MKLTPTGLLLLGSLAALTGCASSSGGFGHQSATRDVYLRGEPLAVANVAAATHEVLPSIDLQAALERALVQAPEDLKRAGLRRELEQAVLEGLESLELAQIVLEWDPEEPLATEFVASGSYAAADPWHRGPLPIPAGKSLLGRVRVGVVPWPHKLERDQLLIAVAQVEFFSHGRGSSFLASALASELLRDVVANLKAQAETAGLQSSSTPFPR